MAWLVLMTHVKRYHLGTLFQKLSRSGLNFALFLIIAPVFEYILLAFSYDMDHVQFLCYCLHFHFLIGSRCSINGYSEFAYYSYLFCSCLLCKMMGLQVTTMEDFLTGIGFFEEVQGHEKVSETHGVGSGF